MKKLILTLAVAAFAFSPAMVPQSEAAVAQKHTAKHQDKAVKKANAGKHHGKKHKKHHHKKHHKHHRKSSTVV
jgi:Ni/Co efflux regulator RcnB